VEQWGLAGLLHDIDIMETAGDLTRHGVVGAGVLRELKFAEPVVRAVQAHDDRAGEARVSRMDHGVYCADQMYWVVSAAGFGFGSEKLNAGNAAEIWERARGVPSKQAVMGQVTRECGEIGMTMAQVVGAVQTASRKLSER